MSHIVRGLPPITITSSSTPKTSWTGLIDDANSITVYLTSGGGLLTSNLGLEVSPIDFSDLTGNLYSTLSTAFFTEMQTAFTSGLALTLTNISYRSFRFSTSTLTVSSGTVVAYATKQISV